MMRQWTQVPPLLKFTKSNISLQLVWKISLEMPNCHVSNIFTITKAPDWIKRLIQIWIIRMAVFAMRHNIKIYPTIQCKFLLILKMGVPVSVPTGCNVLKSAYPFSVLWFTDILAYLWKQTELWDCLLF